MGLFKKSIIIVLCLVCYVYNPYQLRSNFFNILNSVVRLAQPQNPNSLKFVMRNTTGDFDQLTSLVEEFFTKSLADNTTEQQFRSFLELKATKRHRGLESCLDWALGAYKFALPFLIIQGVSMLLKLFERKGDAGSPSQAGRASNLHSPGRRKKREEFGRQVMQKDRRDSSNSLASGGAEMDPLALSLRGDSPKLSSRLGQPSSGVVQMGRSASSHAFGS